MWKCHKHLREYFKTFRWKLLQTNFPSRNQNSNTPQKVNKTHSNIYWNSFHLLESNKQISKSNSAEIKSVKKTVDIVEKLCYFLSNFSWMFYRVFLLDFPQFFWVVLFKCSQVLDKKECSEVLGLLKDWLYYFMQAHFTKCSNKPIGTLLIQLDPHLNFSCFTTTHW